jgi:hypothetical protein
MFHHLANALIPVAVALLAATVVARLTLELPEAAPASRRAAAKYLEPLSTWTLAALVACGVAELLGGGLSGLGVALLLMVGAGVLLLRVAVPDAEVAPAPVAPEPVTPRVPAPTPPQPATPLRPTDGALWAGRRDGADHRSGLWRQS